MPQSEDYPFRRLMVDHLFYGTTRVWWELDPRFTVPPPHSFQLQASYAGTETALDWVDIGDPATNAYFLQDDTTREHTGKLLLTHYRVILTADGTKYVSNPQGIYGWLDRKNWNIAREIVRKERLRMGLVSRPGYLLKRFRYGVKSTANTDTLTDGIIDSGNLSSWGTEFKVGYHPAVHLAADISGDNMTEYRGGANISANDSAPVEVSARIVGFPMVNKEDVWVDAFTDQRWAFHDIALTTSLRGVPLVTNVKLRLLPHSDVVYKIPVTSESYDTLGDEDAQPTQGSGCVRVDHDYKEESIYVYQTADCCGIEGATIMAFTAADWAGGARTAEYAVATSQTTANGTWAWAMQLDPGDYILLFEKPGEYGPDTVEITVTGPPPSPSSSTSSISSSFGPY